MNVSHAFRSSKNISKKLQIEESLRQFKDAFQISQQEPELK